MFDKHREHIYIMWESDTNELHEISSKTKNYKILSTWTV